MTKSDLIAFEAEVVKRFEAGEIRGPVHISGGNEGDLIYIFNGIDSQDWIFSTYRNHYHALLHGIPPDQVMAQIVAGKSMNLAFPEYRFFTSAIVGGPLPIAVGVALALKRQGSDRQVWCFTGDMAARSGAFREATQYARGHHLPIRWIIEDNGLACDTPTDDAWGRETAGMPVQRYVYERTFPHVGTGTYVNF